MLVLSRRPDEEVIIASNIRITVLAIRGSHVQLGFSAPGDMTIIRSELVSSDERPNGRASPQTFGSSKHVQQPRPPSSRRRDRPPICPRLET
jgi:carbon storage regulator